jgi:hypothetical protein
MPSMAKTAHTLRKAQPSVWRVLTIGGARPGSHAESSSSFRLRQQRMVRRCAQAYTTPRTAQARAMRAMEPSGAIGRVARRRSRSAARRGSSSDMA